MRARKLKPNLRAVVLDLLVEDAELVRNAITRDRLVSSLPGETLPASRRRRDRLDVLADRIHRAVRGAR